MNKQDNVLQELIRMKANNCFKQFIEYIRFPFFKNLEENTKITFDYPMTIFVGQNGCGKSSVVQALYGARDDHSVGDFWFETDVDPIKENGKINCLIYSYYSESAKRHIECLKTRGKRLNNPDYWEPSRALKKYAMEIIPQLNKEDAIPPGRNQTRWIGLKREVLYIDFRSELSAFDKYFYFETPSKRKTINTKQDYLRFHAKELKKIIIKTDCYKNKKYKKRHDLSQQELKFISEILGKEYKSGKLIHHNCYKNWGDSVIFETNYSKYTEAFAGSGETSIVKIVHEVLNAKDYTLVLLDEPEVSLYPGAQKRLQQFLLEQIKLKKLQVVISTHSPILLEGLPSNAIKVFYQLPNGKFHVENEKSPDQAFYFLEQSQQNKKEIIVEDKLAKLIIEAVLKSMGEDTANLFQVKYFPGGESSFKQKHIAIYSQENNSNKFIIFDGDQKKSHFDPQNLKDSDKNEKRLNEIIKEQTGEEIKFSIDGNSGQGNKNQKIELMIRYLEYYYSNVFYLPGNTRPECIIWDNDKARQLLNSKELHNEIQQEQDYKIKFERLTQMVCTDSTSDTIYYLEKMFVKHLIDNSQNNPNYKKIVEIINKIKS